MPARKKVVISLLTARQDFQHQQEQDARAAAATAGFDVEVVFAENNPAVQIQQLEVYVKAAPEARPVAFVLEAVAAVGFERIARASLQARIGWVICSARAPYLETLRKEFPSALITSATSDDMEIGRIQARHCLALLPAGGNILYVEGPSMAPAAIFRRRMAEQELKGSAVSIAHSLSSDWTEAGAEWAVSTWLSQEDSQEVRFDLVAAQNDAMAIGARKAIEAQRPEWLKLPFIGCDGLPDGGQRYVQDGLLAATVVKPTTAGAGVELVARFERGEQVPPFVVLPPRSLPAIEELARRR